MHRIDTDDAAPGGLFQEGVPETGQRATAVSADWLNAVQEEVCAVLAAASMSPSKPNNAQLLAAISALITAALPSLTPYVKTDGSRAMTGALTLAGNGSSALDAVPKQQLDSSIDGCVALAGDTMTGPLTLVGNASAALHAVPKQQLDSAVAAVYPVPTGAVVAFAMSGVPSGWLECDGSAVSRSTYAALFGAVGTTYGAGDGSSTFNLPDLRGEFVRGWDHGRSVDAGRAFGSTQTDALQNITGSFGEGKGDVSTRGAATGAFADDGPASEQVGGDAKPTYPGLTFDASRVVRTAAETRPRNLALMYCIRT